MSFILLLALLVPPSQVAGDDLRPGLRAVYRSGGETLERVDPKPSFNWGLSSPHPRLPAGPFEVEWTGFLHIQEPDTIIFDAEVAGRVRIAVGSVLLDGRALDLKPGFHPLKIEFSSQEGVPARLKLWWEGKLFSREPLPPFRLRHASKDAPESASERGRAEVARFGCARCHSKAFPGVDDPPPGPSLADAGRRLNRPWLLDWLEDPHKIGSGSRMPALFAADRKGFVERSIVADYLIRATSTGERRGAATVPGDTRLGKRHFQGLGCGACHFLLDEPLDEQPQVGQSRLEGLNDRLSQGDLSAFLLNPQARYPDARMPRLPMPPETARDIAAYILVNQKPPVPDEAVSGRADQKELDETFKRLGVRNLDAAGQALVREKRCVECHAGLGEPVRVDIPIKTSVGDCRGPRFTIDEGTKKAIAAFLEVSRKEVHSSPFHSRQQLLGRLGCLKCHQRDGERPPPIEEVGSTYGGAYMQKVPFQRTPRLLNAGSKYTPEHLRTTIRDGATGARGREYTYRMPAFGDRVDEIIQALAEGDGDLPAPAALASAVADPTLHTMGPSLVGFEGYSCVSCHLWKQALMTEADPGALGPELTTVTTRIRREWFDRWMEDPARIHPGTPMPQIFRKGQPATLKSVLEGDALKQRDALWAYFSKGREATSPKPLPPIAVPVPPGGPLVAQVPMRLPDNTLVESITVLYPSNDLLVFDVGSGGLRAAFTGGQVLRQLRGRLRFYKAQGTAVPVPAAVGDLIFTGYDRLADGVRLRYKDGADEWRLDGRKVTRGGKVVLELSEAKAAPPIEKMVVTDPGTPEGSLERPGYRAVAYPRPKMENGEDLVMPGAIAVDPRDNRVFVASMKRGEIFVLNDPKGDGTGAKFEDYAGGLFQEAFSMIAESDGLYVLHRRNLTKVIDSDGDGRADRFDRALGLPHGVGDTYDYGYGLARDKTGAWVLSYAPYANQTMPGAGSMLRFGANGPEEVAYGFRNPVGWCAGPEGEIFYTDNQGEWVASNKLCAIVPGRFFGFPNNAQKEHAKKPVGKTTIWVPYAWARSVNGVTWCNTGGKFGPFEGQIFMAELMYGGAIVRANVEKVNGEWQGACFPFWGKGLLGPLALAFDTRGRLYVGGITEPGWMSQPDRGALFRIDWTGETPFEIRSIHARPQGFRLVFTAPVDPKSAADLASFTVEHYRYEYTGAYGSPELDRTRALMEKVDVATDGLSAELTCPLVRDRVYMIAARGLKSAKGQSLVHPSGAYTLNEIPGR